MAETKKKVPIMGKIIEAKSDLAKAIMGGNKKLIKKHIQCLENLRNDWVTYPEEPGHGYSGGLSDEDMYSPSECSKSSEEYSSSDGWDSNDEDHVVEESVKKTTKRVACRCPLEGCKSSVIHLPRHLREVHKWTRERANKATSRFGMRKSFLSKPLLPELSELSEKTLQEKKKKKKRRDYHRHRACPIAGCHAVVKRLPNHIQQVHKDIKRGSPVYKQILRDARAFKTWQPLDAVPSNPVVEHGQSSNNTEDCEMGELDEQLCEEYEMELVEETDNVEEEENVMDEEETFRDFCQWLQTADGGRRDEKMAKQHCSQVRKMLVTIDSERKLSSLFNKNLIRDRFLKDYAEKMYKPDTVKAHLLSLRNFCSFVRTEEPSSVTVNADTIQKIEEKARLWSSSYKKDSNRRHLEKQNEDLEKLVTPEMVSKFERSESARTAISYIGQLSGAHALEVNQSMYTLIRDFILTEMTIANAHRSGVLANMTIEEFKKVKKTNQGSMLISVKNHKTADVHGPARVVLTPTLFSYLDVYVNEVRSCVAISSSEKDSNSPSFVFLSWNGQKLQSGQISTAIDSAWQKAEMEGHVCSTIFRKSTVTKVHEDHKDLKGDLADLMGHKPSTAERFYRLREKEEACVEAANNLSSIMRKPQKKPVSRNTTATATKSLSQECLTKERLTWKEEDVNAIKELFSEEIKEKSVTMEVVRGKIQGHAALEQLDAKRVCDRIRSEWRNSTSNPESDKAADCMPETEPPEQVETLSAKMSRFFKASDAKESCNSSDVVGPSNSSYLSKNIFSDNERKVLLRMCGTMVRGGVVSKPAIKERLEKEEEGKELLNKFSINQLVNRLKYERRLIKNNSCR
ncbi:uncharacterized protein [Montipora capricornis]|uniref:uncharacterized protein n=1 Tax=Montipora capricornis TaxID=246305 RepID=UPI0035F17EB5